MSTNLVGDGAEVLLVVAVGGMLWSAVARLLHGRIGVVRCRACGRTGSRAYPRCPWCEQPRG
ncbi:MAG: hypothetical protein ACR2LJ_06360 [Acidimicrobiales bacterium]